MDISSSSVSAQLSLDNIVTLYFQLVPQVLMRNLLHNSAAYENRWMPVSGKLFWIRTANEIKQDVI